MHMSATLRLASLQLKGATLVKRFMPSIIILSSSPSVAAAQLQPHKSNGFALLQCLRLAWVPRMAWVAWMEFMD